MTQGAKGVKDTDRSLWWVWYFTDLYAKYDDTAAIGIV